MDATSFERPPADAHEAHPGTLPRRDDPGPRMPLGPALLSAAILFALLALDDLWRPGPDQNLFLRWTRTASNHPLRTWLALFLATLAARPGCGIPPVRSGDRPL